MRVRYITYTFNGMGLERMHMHACTTLAVYTRVLRV